MERITEKSIGCFQYGLKGFVDLNQIKLHQEVNKDLGIFVPIETMPEDVILVNSSNKTYVFDIQNIKK